MTQHQPTEHHHDHADRAMSWYGFGSPVGLAILILSLGLTALCLRVALFGLP
jgi:hypothetical protein